MREPIIGKFTVSVDNVVILFWAREREREFLFFLLNFVELIVHSMLYIYFLTSLYMYFRTRVVYILNIDVLLQPQ